MNTEQASDTAARLGMRAGAGIGLASHAPGAIEPIGAAVDLVPNRSNPATQSTATQPVNHLKIRRGIEADREGVRALMRQHHSNSVFRAQPFADWKFDAQFDLLVQHPDKTLALVAHYRGSVVGVAWAVCDQYMLSDGPPFVSVQVIAVEQHAINGIGRIKTFLGLVAAIRPTAQVTTHAQIHVTTGTNLESTDKLMKAAGAKSVGGSYVV